MRTIERVLDRVQAHTAALDAARKLYAPRTSPTFLLFDFVNSSELGLSSILAWMFNPHGSHAQGGLFLSLFVETFTPGLEIDAANVSVVTEAPAGDGRRIDILIRSAGRALAIENKPWASDQNRQLADYCSFLDRDARGKYTLVYLSGPGLLPAQTSIDADELSMRTDGRHVVLASYSRLAEWLDVCSEKTRAPDTRIFLEHFARFARDAFGGTSMPEERSALVELLTRNSENLSAAAEIAHVWGDVKLLSIRSMVEQVQRKAPDAWKITDDLDQWHRGGGITVDFGSGSNGCFRLEFDNTDFNSLCYGCVGPDTEQVRSRLRRKICDNFGEPVGTIEEWAWWKWATPTDAICALELHWGSSTTVWSKLIDGTYAEKVFEVATKFERALQDEVLKA